VPEAKNQIYFNEIRQTAASVCMYRHEYETSFAPSECTVSALDSFNSLSEYARNYERLLFAYFVVPIQQLLELYACLTEVT
jgi:hypothetical protein